VAHLEDRWERRLVDGSKARTSRHGTGDRWRARYLDPTGAERSRSFARKVDAERFLATVEADKARGRYVDQTLSTTVAEQARAYLATRLHRASTAQHQARHVELHIAGTPLGARRLVAVRPSEVQAWATDRSQHLAPSTMRVLVGLLRSVYASAVEDGLVAASPVRRVKLPKLERARVVPLTVEQVRALANAMPDRARALVVTQAGLGLRLGELLALRVSDVDFLRRTVSVTCQLGRDGRSLLPPKTPRSRRVLPLPGVVADALAAHLAAYPAGEDGWVFTSTTGAPWGHARYGAQVWSAARAHAGLPGTATTHDLRHHYASVLLAAGESVVAVAERLGHENATLVLTTYGHLMPDSEDRTRRAVDDAWSGLAANSDGPGTARVVAVLP